MDSQWRPLVQSLLCVMGSWCVACGGTSSGSDNAAGSGSATVPSDATPPSVGSGRGSRATFDASTDDAAIGFATPLPVDDGAATPPPFIADPPPPKPAPTFNPVSS